MTAMELMQYLGQIDDSLIEGAAQPPKNTVRPIRRGLLIAAVVAILLFLVGCTVGYYLYPSMTETLFGENGRQTYKADTVRGLYEPGGIRTELDQRLAEKYIYPNTFPAEGTLSDEKTTLTALSYIVDRASCTAAVYLKLEHPPEYEVYSSGQILFQWQGKWNGWYIYPTAIGQDGIIARCVIDSAATTEDSLYCLLLFSCEPGCTGLELQIGNAPDRIALSFPEKTDFPVITLADGAIRLTPFGMMVASDLVVPSADAAKYADAPKELALQYKDGSEYLIQHTGFALSDGSEDIIGYTYGMALDITLQNRVYIFNRVVDIRNVTAFRINDRIYPI